MAATGIEPLTFKWRKDKCLYIPFQL
jgi:hypothetical protein